MSSRGVSVGVEITGSAKGFKVAAEDAARASALLQKKMLDHAKAINQSSKEISNFVNELKRIGEVAGIAFSVGAIVSFTKESMKLAAEAEGVRNAFMRIGDAKGILEGMKKATRGVIEESDLMTFAVKAQNLHIPLKNISTYLEFATNRAITTGKSINELADKMIMAVGRGSKATRAFVELGLNANDVKEAFKDTGSVFGLVTDALEKMGPVADTAAVRFGRLQANVKNLKETWGEFLNNSKVVQTGLEGTALTLKKLADPNLNFWEKLMWSGKKYEKWQKAGEDWMKLQQPGYDRLSGKSNLPATTNIPKEIETLQTLKLNLNELETQLNTTDITDKKLTASIRDQIKALREQIQEIETGVHVMTKAEMALSKTNSFILNKDYGNLKMPTFGTKPEMPGLQKWDTTAVLEAAKNREAGIRSLEKMTKEMELQKEVASGLDSVFSSMFSNIDKGFKGMAESAVQAIERIAAELAAKALTLAIMNALFPGLGTGIGAIGNGIGMPIGGLFAGGTNNAPGGLSLVGERGPELVNLPKGAQVIPNNKLGNQRIEIFGRLEGHDLYLSNQRYSIKLAQNT